MNTIKATVFISFMFHITFGVDDAKPLRQGFICQSQTGKISCPQNSTIAVVNASFGKSLDDESCGKNELLNGSCFIQTTYTIQRMCNCTNACRITVRNRLFNNSDQCPGPNKLLFITFMCVDSVEPECELAIPTDNPTSGPKDDNSTTAIWVPILIVLLVIACLLIALVLLCKRKRWKWNVMNSKADSRPVENDAVAVTTVSMSKTDHLYHVIDHVGTSCEDANKLSVAKASDNNPLSSVNKEPIYDTVDGDESSVDSFSDSEGDLPTNAENDQSYLAPRAFPVSRSIEELPKDHIYTIPE